MHEQIDKVSAGASQPGWFEFRRRYFADDVAKNLRGSISDLGAEEDGARLEGGGERVRAVD